MMASSFIHVLWFDLWDLGFNRYYFCSQRLLMHFKGWKLMRWNLLIKDCKIILIGQRCHNLFFVLPLPLSSYLVVFLHFPLFILCRVVQTVAMVPKLKKYLGKLEESKCYALIQVGIIFVTWNALIHVMWLRIEAKT